MLRMESASSALPTQSAHQQDVHAHQKPISSEEAVLHALLMVDGMELSAPVPQDSSQSTDSVSDVDKIPSLTGRAVSAIEVTSRHPQVAHSAMKLVEPVLVRMPINA